MTEMLIDFGVIGVAGGQNVKKNRITKYIQAEVLLAVPQVLGILHDPHSKLPALPGRFLSSDLSSLNAT
jgi:hypothetical protein